MSPDTGVTKPVRRRAWRAMSAAALLLSSATLLLSVILFGRQADISTADCGRIHALTTTLDKMIADSSKSLDAYLADGTITQVQLERELKRIEQQRAQLAEADCLPKDPNGL